MYWAVRTVKMKACKDCTKISRPKIAMLKIKATTPAVLLMIDSRVQQQVFPAQHEHQNSRWPANMLAKSRKDKVIGRTMMLETNSSGMINGHMNTGTPEGSDGVLEVTEEAVLGDADAVVDHPHHAAPDRTASLRVTGSAAR